MHPRGRAGAGLPQHRRHGCDVASPVDLDGRPRMPELPGGHFPAQDPERLVLDPIGH